MTWWGHAVMICGGTPRGIVGHGIMSASVVAVVMVRVSGAVLTQISQVLRRKMEPPAPHLHPDRWRGYSTALLLWQYT